MCDKWCFLQKALILLICLPPLFSTSQHDPFTAKVVDARTVRLDTAFDAYQVYTLDLKELSQYVQADDFDQHISLNLPGYGEFEIDLFPNKLKADNYSILIHKESGIETIPDDGHVKTFIGHLEGGQYEVRLTIDEDFINGFIDRPKDILYFESLRFREDGSPSDQILVYKRSSIKEEFQLDCDPLLDTAYVHEEDGNRSNLRSAGECLEVEIAFANDWLMYQDYNQNVSDVENHNMAVINNVQANYDNEFADELIFNVVQIFISTCNICDPWTSSTNAGNLLSSFSNWAGNGFSNQHDVASLWTDRNFNGSTIGIAWLDAVCRNSRYNVLQDFTSNANSLRVLVAHELGHNFGSGHDPAGSGTIMAPSVNNTNTWSASSVNQINSYVNSVNCLELCPVAQPPSASIGSDLEEGCTPLVVQFTDISTGQIDFWDWTFEGGSPATSTQENPVVTYSNPGSYDVSLEVTNVVGSDIIDLFNYIVVLPDPEGDFTYNWDELTVLFINLSSNADSYFWDFGDESTSVEVNPEHTYDEDGVYEVTLTASNECGDNDYQLLIEVVSLPTADFTFNPEDGCVPLIVNFFESASSNVDEYFWEFPGGDPNFSVLANPVVIYHNPGTYSVTLTVINEVGEDVRAIDDIIIVDPLPIADFDAVVTGLIADFSNFSNNAFAYSWDFGDGSTSIESNPSHEYQNGGGYTVMLISENECGSDTAFLMISVASAPLAGIGISQSIGCSPFVVQYTSTSNGEVDTYVWSFPGGSPAASTEMNPIVTYQNPGIYHAELIVTNAVGSDTILVTNAVIVQEPVIGGFSFDVIGSTAYFYNESTGEDAFIWEIGGFEYSEANPSVTFSEDGDYTAQLTVTGPCGSDTVVQNLTISTLPTAGIGASAVSGCEPLIVQYNDQSSSNVIAWEWSFPGGIPSSSNESDPEITYEVPGIYSVGLIVTSTAGTDQVVIDDIITVDPLPEAFFGAVQSGTEVAFDNTSIDATSYVWLFGDGSSSAEENPVHDYGEFGVYEILLIAINDCGADTSLIDFQLAGLPVPWFMANTEIGCAPFEVQFVDDSQNGAEEWDWSFPGGTPSSSREQNPVVIYDAPGLYDITLKVSNIAGAQSLVREEYIEVGDGPTSEFSTDIDADQVTFLNLSFDAEGYFWDFGDGETDTTEHPVHVFNITGTYLVELIATNSCGIDTFSIEVSVETTATLMPDDGVHIQLWPNPNNGIFTMDFQDLKGDLDMTLVDITGRVVYSELITAPGRVEISHSEEFAPGLYHVVIQGKDMSEVLRVVIQ